jgi:hypothetical protein
MRELVCSVELEGYSQELPKPNKLPDSKDNKKLEKPIKFNYPLVGKGEMGKSGDKASSSYSANQLQPLRGFTNVLHAMQQKPAKKSVVGAKRRIIETSPSSDINPLTIPPKPKRRSKP